MKQRAANFMVKVAGWALVVSGVFAGFVPLIPGIVLIVIGLYILSRRSAWFKRLFDRLRGLHAPTDRIIVRFEEKLETFLGMFKY